LAEGRVRQRLNQPEDHVDIGSSAQLIRRERVSRQIDISVEIDADQLKTMFKVRLRSGGICAISGIFSMSSSSEQDVIGRAKGTDKVRSRFCSISAGRKAFPLSDPRHCPEPTSSMVMDCHRLLCCASHRRSKLMSKLLQWTSSWISQAAGVAARFDGIVPEYLDPSPV
jgi:hypothetical protein